MKERQRPYLAYLLRLWQIRDEGTDRLARIPGECPYRRAAGLCPPGPARRLSARAARPWRRPRRPGSSMNAHPRRLYRSKENEKKTENRFDVLL